MLPSIQKFLADPSCENLIDPETTLNRVIEKATRMMPQRSVASIETGMHAMIHSRFVLHTHSVYINVAACMEGGEALLQEALDIPFVYIPYTNPGFFLARAIEMAVARQGERLPSIFILENHGVTVHDDDQFRALELTLSLTERMAQFLKRQRAWEPFTVRKVHMDNQNHLFPDSVVFAGLKPQKLSAAKKRAYHEIASTAAYIQKTIEKLGGKARYISDNDVRYIQNMEREKHRRLSFQETA